jgi:DNA-binding protein H-NS
MDLSTLSITELQALQNEVAAELPKRKAAERAQAIDELHAIAQSRGFALHELVGSPIKATKATRAPAPAQYANPSDPSQTWSGRGRLPAWAAAHKSAHGSFDGLRIQ